jgi:hypothetical protein
LFTAGLRSTERKSSTKPDTSATRQAGHESGYFLQPDIAGSARRDLIHSVGEKHENPDQEIKCPGRKPSRRFTAPAAAHGLSLALGDPEKQSLTRDIDP